MAEEDREQDVIELNDEGGSQRRREPDSVTDGDIRSRPSQKSR